MIEVMCRNRGEQRVFASRIVDVRIGDSVVIVTESGAEREVSQSKKQPVAGDWLLVSGEGVAAVVSEEQYLQRCTPVGGC